MGDMSITSRMNLSVYLLSSTLFDVTTPYSKCTTRYIINWFMKEIKVMWSKTWLPEWYFPLHYFMVSFTKSVRCRVARHHTFPTMWPVFLLYPLMSGVVTSDSVSRVQNFTQHVRKVFFCKWVVEEFYHELLSSKIYNRIKFLLSYI